MTWLRSRVAPLFITLSVSALITFGDTITLDLMSLGQRTLRAIQLGNSFPANVKPDLSVLRAGSTHHRTATREGVVDVNTAPFGRNLIRQGKSQRDVTGYEHVVQLVFDRVVRQFQMRLA